MTPFSLPSCQSSLTSQVGSPNKKARLQFQRAFVQSVPVFFGRVIKTIPRVLQRREYNTILLAGGSQNLSALCALCGEVNFDPRSHSLPIS
jgi:hypothetical protein